MSEQPPEGLIGAGDAQLLDFVGVSAGRSGVDCDLEVFSAGIEKADKMEQVLKQVARHLSANTNYAAMISAPQYHRNKLKFVQLSRMSGNQIVVVIVVEGNIIKNLYAINGF